MFWKLILFGPLSTLLSLPWIRLKWELKLQVSYGSFNMLWNLLASKFHKALLTSLFMFCDVAFIVIETLQRIVIFLFLFLFYCASEIVFVTMKWLHLGFDDVFNFALYSKTFPLFARMTPSIVFFNVKYNLRVSWFPSPSIVFSQPLLLCSFNVILKFFLQLQ